jgi:hypothetical protein
MLSFNGSRNKTYQGERIPLFHGLSSQDLPCVSCESFVEALRGRASKPKEAEEAITRQLGCLSAASTWLGVYPGNILGGDWEAGSHVEMEVPIASPAPEPRRQGRECFHEGIAIGLGDSQKKFRVLSAATFF